MADDVSVTRMLTQRIAALVSEAAEVQRGRGRKRRGRQARPLARRGSVEAALIRLRGQLVRRHARGGFGGVPVSTADLVDLHARQGGLCAYTGLPYEAGAGPLGVAVDRVDRVDRELGYVAGNVALVAAFAAAARGPWALAEVRPLWAYLGRGAPSA